MAILSIFSIFYFKTTVVKTKKDRKGWKTGVIATIISNYLIGAFWPHHILHYYSTLPAGIPGISGILQYHQP
jgi:hypothetical protein